MPISLGPPTTNPKWSKGLLLLFWITQFLTLGFAELVTFGLVFVIGTNGAHKHLPWYFTLSMVSILICNFLVLCTILYEFSYLGSLAHLSSSRYFRIQCVKSFYFALLVILICVTGSGMNMDKSLHGAAYAWAVTWRFGIFVGPFWSALAYAMLMKFRESRMWRDEGVSL